MKFKYLLLIFFINSCGGGGSSAILVPDIEPPGNSYQAISCQNYDGPMDKIIWIDDFLELSYLDNWSTMTGNGAEYGIPGWGNNERQFYTDDIKNSNIVNGCLRITPLNESKEGFNYTSAKLITENKVDFTHPGKITVRFRSPEGVGMWPAIWMMPSESIYGGWPASGEIDLVEIRGDNMQEILSTVHYGSDPANHKYQGGTYLLSQSNNLNEVFHELSFIWQDNSMKFILDNQYTIFEITSNQIGFDENYPFNEVFYFNYTSAKLITENKVDFTHPGKITVRFRSPEGVGMWPAIWMMPSESIYGGWPASGEIDLVEIRGDNMQEILSTVHYGSDPANHKYQGGTYLLSQSNNLNEVFHELSFIWQDNSMKFILDNQYTVFEITSNQIGFDENYPFNEVFYLIINVAIGGNFVGNYVNNNDLCYAANAANCSDNKRLLIDWVKYETL